MLAAASPYFATKPPVPIYIYALLLKLKRRRDSARWTISNFLPKSPIQSFLPSVFRQYGSRTIGDCVAFYHRSYRRAKTECLQAMESLVYENSPLADYLQGEWTGRWKRVGERLIDFGVGEGENDYSWPLDPMDNEDGDQSGESMSNFAPRGTSKFQHRIRNKLPKPLDLQVARQSEAIGRIYDACAVCHHMPLYSRLDVEKGN